MSDSPFYKDTGKIGLASQISMQFREKMFRKFMSVMGPDASLKVLDVGVTSDDKYQESNYFEKLYPYKEKIVCVGTEDGTHLESKYPGLKFIKVISGEPLPFGDNEFDIAFSNAVIEHVGNTDSQRAFVKEILRASKSFFLTTPNRWFPVEFHTALPLLHFLPKKLYRRVLDAFGESYWSKEENLNLLSRNELRALFPEKTTVKMDGINMFGITTNLIAYQPPNNKGDSL
jgi:SAM-dependent methyltransferase